MSVNSTSIVSNYPNTPLACSLARRTDDSSLRRRGHDPACDRRFPLRTLRPEDEPRRAAGSDIRRDDQRLVVERGLQGGEKQRPSARLCRNLRLRQRSPHPGRHHHDAVLDVTFRFLNPWDWAVFGEWHELHFEYVNTATPISVIPTSQIQSPPPSLPLTDKRRGKCGSQRHSRCS